ncbi:Zinc-binding domain [Trypanosoma melophagium]|uniref:Zinc-binding domain n=1 Tax=Trypanosoma melophagium TaxID=715481 RepID=UPI00351A3EBC|nr:Zinc-binding domain [Trypanosoma melophagium]
MLNLTQLLLMRPRHIMFTPPPLSRRRGMFRCRVCRNEWSSSNVWVTKATQRVYQGESCDGCGTTTKPYYVGRPEETIFNRVKTPHPVKPGVSGSRHGRKLKHMRFDWRIQQGRKVRIHEDAVTFDQQGTCSVLYVKCTNPTIILFANGTTRTVEVWEKIGPTFFCEMESPFILPCWWSREPRLSGLVRIAPIPEESKVLLPFSLVLIAGGVLFLLLPVFLIVLRNGYRLLNLIGVGRLRGSTDSNVPGDLQEEVGNRLVRDPSIRVVYPLEDGDWANGVVCPNAFAEGRLQILKRYFDSRRKRAAQAESSTEPFGTASNGSECSSAYDDDDLPVNECYVCLSRFRKRVIWWPCGHWICATCSRRVLRASGSSQAASCPNCRGSFRHEELVALYIIPRPTNQSPEDVPVEPNDHIEG